MFLRDIENYYKSAFLRFGQTSRGVDWNPNGHDERFEQFLPLLSSVNRSISVLDFGAGYGALVDFLVKKDIDFNYVGVEIVDASRESGKERFRQSQHISFVRTLEEAKHCDIEFDFVVASGAFNVKLNVEQRTWQEYVFETLQDFEGVAKVGIGANFLSTNAQTEKRQEKLYYADPNQVEQFFSSKLNASVTLNHTYSPWEFTVTGLLR